MSSRIIQAAIMLADRSEMILLDNDVMMSLSVISIPPYFCRVRTDVVDGFLLDRGFQIFLTGYPEVKVGLTGTMKASLHVRQGWGDVFPPTSYKCQEAHHKIFQNLEISEHT